MVRVGCVSFLNAKPLIDGVAVAAEIPGGTPGATPGAAGVPVTYAVPAKLLGLLESGEVDIALCPTIDYHRAAMPLVIVPVGGIVSDGPTFTVRLYSRVPIERITTVHADTDSHTSVALLRVLLDEVYGLRPALVDYAAGTQPPPEAMLLIGDKVVTQSPRAVEYPHQMDLGEAWKRQTGLPFVFATWMAREGAALGDVPARLEAARVRNAARVGEIAERYAGPHGWPLELARDYLGRILGYTIGPRELEAMARFGEKAAALGAIGRAWPLQLSNDVSV